jgi:predicted transcriptional regulator
VQDYLVRGSDRALAIVRDDQLLGLVCIADIRNVTPNQWSAIRVSDVMRPADSLTTTAPARPLSEAFEQMVRQDVDQLPVVANGKLVGMLRRRDVTRWLELAWRPGMARPRPEATGSGRPATRAPGSRGDQPVARPV